MNGIRNRLHLNVLAIVAGGALIATLSACDDDDNPTATDPVITESSITILKIDPKPGAVVNEDDIINATLAYRIADDEVSEYGFSVSIKFLSFDEGSVFSVGEQAHTEVTHRSGSATLSYALDRVWDHRPLQMQHPPRLWFYLHNETSDSTSVVIAWSNEVAYAEE